MDSPKFIPYDDIGITIAVIAIALAFIVLVWNAVKAIHDWKAMAKKPTSDRIENHETRITNIESWIEKADVKLNDDYAFRQDEILFNQLVLKSIKQLLNHEIDGNNKAGLVTMEKEIDNFLMERAQRH